MYTDADSDVTNVTDSAVVVLQNLGGPVQSNFVLSARFTIQSASEAPAGTGERLGIMLAALADSTLSTGYFFSVGAGEDVVGFEEGMAFYKNGTHSGQTTNFIILGPATDGSETWKLTVHGEYLPGNQIRFGFRAENETDGLVSSNSWTDSSGLVCTGAHFGLVVAHTRYVSSVRFDDVSIAFGDGSGAGLSKGVLFLDEFTTPPESNGWTIVQKDASRITVTGGVCRVASGNGDMYWDYINYRNLFRRPCPTTNDFCATLRVNSFQPTNDNVQLNLLAYDDENSHVRHIYGHLEGARAFRFFAETNEEPQAAFFDVPADFGDGRFWMRLTKQGTIYRQYWSTNGLTFHRTGSALDYGDGTPAYVAFWVGADFEFPATATPAVIESFEVREFPDFPSVAAIDGGTTGMTVFVQNLYEATTARVERCTNLASNDWTNVGTFAVSVDSTNVVDATLPETNRFFYRVVLP
ncbi:MAG: hypothetical protein FJ221_15015 [Lentisphaerae bacterium]|nr:hypothetical protein [Lentisphaerota bacterium]